MQLTLSAKHLCVAAALSLVGAASAQIVVPPSAKAPATAVDTSKPGFRINIHQIESARTGFGDQNQLPAVIAQLESRILDASGQPALNIIDTSYPGFEQPPQPDPTKPYAFIETGGINYNQDATPDNATGVGNIPNDKPIPGVNTGANFSTDNIAMEALAYLDLAIGTYTFAVTSDDGFLVTMGSGANPKDGFATRLGIFNGGRGAAETAFSFRVTEAGFYPIRLVWWEGGGGANVEFYEKRDGQNILINSTNAGAIKAYQVPRTAGTALTATSVSPAPGATGASAQPLIRVNFQNGTTTLDQSSVQLSFNGQPVQATVTPGANNTVSVSYLHPTVLAQNSTNTVSLTFKDNTGASRTESWSFVTGTFITIANGSSVPESSVDKSKRGFNVFVHHAAEASAGLPNSTERAEGQLRGYLINPDTGAPYVNAADPAVSIDTDVINWNQDAPDGATAGNFANEEPIPGLVSGNDNIAAEITTILELPAGLTTLVVNSDDGFRVTAGQNPRAANSQELGVFSGGRGAADTVFQINAPTAGFYPIRLIWYEGGGGANLEFFSITPSGERILLNDPNNANAIKAYRETSVPRLPILDRVSPVGLGAKDAVVTVAIRDQGTAVNQNSIQFTFNGQAVNPTKTVASGVTTLVYDPPGNQTPGTTNKFTVSFTDTTGAAQNFAFEYVTSGELVRRIFSDISGTAISALYNDPKYIANTPDHVDLVPRYESPDGIGVQGLSNDNYGGEILGYLQPTVTADYKFFLSADDGAELWLSTDDNPANAVRIANQPSWNGFREYTSGENVAPRQSAFIRLEAGKKYFTRAAWKEGGGGDHISVAWRTRENPTISNGAPPIEGPVILPFDRVAFTQQPQSITVNRGLPVTFSAAFVSAQGNATIQWLRNGAPISGATERSYTIPAVALSDSGARFSVRVTDASGSATSSEATLTVNDDTARPTIAGAAPFDFNSIVVQFNEPVTDASLAAGNFNLGAGLPVTEVVRLSPSSVKVVTSAKLTLGSTVTVNASNISDFAGNSGTATGTASVTLSPGFVRADLYTGIGGVLVSDLQASEKYPNRPDQTRWLPAFEGPVDILDNYGERIRGWFTPPTTGSYVFLISSDDNGELWLSTDETEANAQLIATEPAWNGFRQWINGGNQASRQDPPQNISAPITLTAGRPYFIQAMMKEGGSGDNLAVTYRMANEPNPASGTPSVLRGSVISTFAPPGAPQTITITTPPASQSVEIGARANFTIAATAAPTAALAFQWQSSTDGGVTWTNIPNANASSFSPPSALQGHHGAQFRVVLNTLGGVSTTSPAATLSVGAAVNPARLSVSTANGQITITWDQPGRLQATDNLSPASWADVTGVTGQSYTTAANAARRFYRVVTP